MATREGLATDGRFADTTHSADSTKHHVDYLSTVWKLSLKGKGRATQKENHN
jgi:hypothetical protein